MPGYPGDLTQEEIEEKLLFEFVQSASGGGPQVTIPGETASVLVKLVTDAGKGNPPESKEKKADKKPETKKLKED